MSERLPGIRPRPTLGRRLDAASRKAFPAACTALVLLALAAPLHLPGQAQLQPAAALACVFFWSLFRPASMSPPIVFGLGLLSDLLGLTPPGISVLVLLVVHGLAVAAALGWALTSALTFHVMPLRAALFEFGLTAGLYPALAYLFTIAHRGLADPERA